MQIVIDSNYILEWDVKFEHWIIVSKDAHIPVQKNTPVEALINAFYKLKLEYGLCNNEK
jgi:hypothetical protein